MKKKYILTEKTTIENFNAYILNFYKNIIRWCTYQIVYNI